jgi:hypothetical protein
MALSEEERVWIQEHPVVGSDIVGRAPSLRGALEVSASTTSASTATATPTASPGSRSRWPPDRAPASVKLSRTLASSD